MKDMPILFISHGSPLNAILDNAFTKSIRNCTKDIPKPKVILVISAHWETNGVFITSAEKPKQIFDFYGFPKNLYDVKYEPSGDSTCAKDIAENLKQYNVRCTSQRGLDHGAWCILKHMYPNADIPVLQLSLDKSMTEKEHYNLGKALSYLRQKDVLIIASGNVVHNLRVIDMNINAKAYPWAEEFNQWVWTNFENMNHDKLINYLTENDKSKLAAPTSDHYLPLLYISGLQNPQDKITYIFRGIHHSSLSMTCLRIG